MNDYDAGIVMAATNCGKCHTRMFANAEDWIPFTYPAMYRVYLLTTETTSSS
jgi:hypothetical protein